MGNFDHYYDQFAIADFINNTVLTLPGTVQLLAIELDATGRTGIFSEVIYTGEDSLYISIWDSAQIFRNGTFESYFIVCHSPSDH